MSNLVQFERSSAWRCRQQQADARVIHPVQFKCCHVRLGCGGNECVGRRMVIPSRLCAPTSAPTSAPTRTLPSNVIRRKLVVSCSTSVDAPGTVQAAQQQEHTKSEWWAPTSLPVLVGPVELKVIPGRGRGVIASRDIELGELLLCTPPVAIVNTSPGQPRAEGDQLVDLIVDQQLWRRTWFQALYDGTAKSCTACPDLHTPHDAMGEDDGGSAGGVGSSEGAGVAVDATGGVKAGGFASKRTAGGKVGRRPKAKAPIVAPGGLDKKALRRIANTTKLNCYGDNHEDLALCELRGETPRGHIGVWGSFAMLNHSCAPNAINYVVQDSMVVRASRPIGAGEEVFISYLGRPQLWPVLARRTQLQEDYGFECGCERCVQEMQHMDKLEPSQYAELHLNVKHHMRSQFDQAVQDKDTEELDAIYAQLQTSLQSLAQQLRRALVSPRTRLYLLASLYEAEELMIDLCNALGHKDEVAYHLGHTLKFVELVTPGSDLHCIVASQHLAIQIELHGPDSPEAQRALVMSHYAHQARYGPVPPLTLDKLMQLNRTLYD